MLEVYTTKKVEKMTNEEIIAVVKAKEEGKTIEFMDRRDVDMGWLPIDNPTWDFERYNYRVRERKYGNAFSLTTITMVENGNCVRAENVCRNLEGRKVIASDSFWSLWDRPDKLDVVTLNKIQLHFNLYNTEGDGYEFPFVTSDGHRYQYIRLVEEE